MENTRTAITLTAIEAATKAYAHVAKLNPSWSPMQIRPVAAELLTGMIRKGAFVISDAKVGA